MKKRELIIFVIIMFVTLISLFFDSQISRGVSLIRNNFLTEILLGITFVSSEIIIFFFLTSLFLWKEQKRKYILPLWFSLGLSAIVSLLLKIIVHRLRPFQLGIASLLPILESVNYFPWDFSFPSFQAMLAFCAIPILSKEFPKFKYVWIVIASLVAFSRVYFGLHFLSDVLVGALIGYFIGLVVLRLEEKSKFFDNIYRKMFRKK